MIRKSDEQRVRKERMAKLGIVESRAHPDGNVGGLSEKEKLSIV